MSHFLTVVLVPIDTLQGEVESAVKKSLAPFDENMEVEAYLKPCYCVGNRARKEAREVAETRFGSLEFLREAFKTSEDVEWDEFIGPFLSLEDSEFKKHPLKDSPEPNCDNCKGGGEYLTTYNPLSKWDWWVIGGRWDGEVQGVDLNEGAAFDRIYTDEARQLGNNVANSSYLKKAIFSQAMIPPFAVVDLDGNWHECGEMGWFGMVNNEKEEDNWRETVVEILDAAGTCWCVGCDLHI